MWIIVGHRMDMMIDHPQQMRLFMSLEEKAILRMAQMFTSVVDSFFVISGILVTEKCTRLFNE
jgi:peptidoglycan/LPS O-acetylase OafA/YrhL